MAKRAADPGSWQWLWGRAASDTATASAESATRADRRKTSSLESADAAAESRPVADEPSPPPSARRADHQPLGRVGDAPGVVRIRAELPDGEVPQAVDLPALDPTWFRAVRDDTIFFTQEEQQAWFRLLAAVANIPPEAVTSAAVRPVSWRQLFDQPGVYRGRLVQVRGLIRRAEVEIPRSPEAPFKQYYKLWLQPDDHPTSPMILYATRLPEGLPVGDALKVPVTIDAVFFKRAAYRAQGDVWLAPLLVACRIVLRPVGTVTADQPQLPPLWVVAVAAAALGTALAVLLWRRAGKVPKPSSLQAIEVDAPEIAAAIELQSHDATFDGPVDTSPSPDKSESAASGPTDAASQRESDRAAADDSRGGHPSSSLRSDGSREPAERPHEGGAP